MEVLTLTIACHEGCPPAIATYENATAPFVPRPLAQVTAFFDGFELVEPSLVQAPLWRPDGRAPRPRDRERSASTPGSGTRPLPAHESPTASAASASGYSAGCLVSGCLPYAAPSLVRSFGEAVQSGGDAFAAEHLDLLVEFPRLD
jgi:hypothetical protein